MTRSCLNAYACTVANGAVDDDDGTLFATAGIKFWDRAHEHAAGMLSDSYAVPLVLSMMFAARSSRLQESSFVITPTNTLRAC